MNIRRIYPLLCLLCCLLFSSCMSQQLASKSGLYDVPLRHSYKVPVDGFWTWDKGNPYATMESGSLYIAPLDVSLVQEDHPELSANIVILMRDLMAKNMQKTLDDSNQANKPRWVLVDDAAKADIRIDLAVVKLRTQKPLLHIASLFIGHFTPRGVSNAMDYISKGNITLEGTIRDTASGEIAFAFKDSNRAKLKFYQKESYQRAGHVDANLRLWSQRLAKLCRECTADRAGDKTLSERVEARTLAESVKAHIN